MNNFFQKYFQCYVGFSNWSWLILFCFALIVSQILFVQSVRADINGFHISYTVNGHDPGLDHPTVATANDDLNFYIETNFPPTGTMTINGVSYTNQCILSFVRGQVYGIPMTRNPYGQVSSGSVNIGQKNAGEYNPSVHCPVPPNGAYYVTSGITISENNSIANLVSPEPTLSNIRCVDGDKGSVVVTFNTAGFSETTTYAIRFIHDSVTQYVQADGSLGSTELFRTGNEWASTVIDANKQSLIIGQEYQVAIAAKPNGTGSALQYSTTKYFTITPDLCTPPVGETQCGNHNIEFPEQCDDGNLTDGDGCDHNCQTEPVEPSTIDPPTVDIKANGSDNPTALPNNSTVTLSWTSNNATSCTASGSWSGDKATSGSENQGPLSTGTYTYTVQCTGAGGTSSDSVTIQILSPCTITYSYSTTDTEVSAVTNYWSGTVCVNRNLYVASGNTLTIAPGTVVKFFTGGSQEKWRIQNNGIINANGTADQPVYFTSYRDDSVGNDVTAGSSTPQKADWRYIYMLGTSGPSTATFNYTTFRYAGYNSLYPIDIREHNTQTPNRTRPVFRNCTFENNSTGGIYLLNSDILVENINFKNNSGPAIYVENAGYNLGGVEFMGDNNTAFNNGYNGIILDFDAWNNTQWGNRTFYNDLPYIVTNPNEPNRSGMFINSSATTYIESGAIVKVVMDINIYGSLNTVGNQYPTYFTSIKDDDTGKELHPEWFDNGICRSHYPCDTNNDGTATSPAAGDWIRLRYIASNANSPGAGLLDNCIIRYGGYQNTGNISFEQHNSFGKLSPTIKNSIIENSLYSGIFYSTSTPTLENMIIRNNGNAAIFTNSLVNTHANINGSIDIYNNLINGIRYNISSDYTINTDRTFSNKVIHYFNSDGYILASKDIYIANGITLNIEPGTIIKNINTLYSNGNIIAIGTDRQPIYFTSRNDDQAGLLAHPEWFENGICKPHYPCDTNNDGTTTSPSPGDWKNLVFNAGNGQAQGNLNHVVFDYGGYGLTTANIASPGNGQINFYAYNIYNKPEPVISNCSFLNSLHQGIFIEDSNPTLSNASFINNTDAAIFLSGLDYNTNVEFPDSNTVTVYNNGTNGIIVSDGSIDNTRTWYNDLPYVINANFNGIATNGILNIETGSIIKSPNTGFDIYGAINAIGNQEQIIIFTSFYDDLAGTDGTCEAHQICDTNNDGSVTTPDKGNWQGINFDSESAAVPISNLDYVNIKYANNGIEFHDFNDVGQLEPTINHMTISESLGDGVFMQLSNPTLQNLSIENNAGAAIRLAGLVHGNNAVLSGNSFDVHDNAVNGVYVDIDWGLWPWRGYVEQSTSFYNQLPYYIETTNHTITVNSGITLNINPGTTIKFKTTDSNDKFIVNYGTLNFNGTTENPIYLTSAKDDAVGIETHPEWFSSGVCKPHYPCDITNDGTATTPAKEDWFGVQYSGSSAGGKVYNTTFRYGAGGSGNYDYELAFDGVTANTVEVKNCNFNYTNRGLYASNSKLNIHNNIFDSSSDYGVVINNPPTGMIFDHNTIAHFDTGILLTNISQGLTLSNNKISNVITGVWGQTISANGVLMTGNNIDASSYFIRNDSTPFVSGSCASPSTSTTINACVANNWGSYPVTDYPPGQIYKNPGNILYNNYGIQITSPNGGETWRPQSVNNITWTTYNTGGNSRYADLYYSIDNGTTWSMIAQNIDHQGGQIIYGEYAWTLPVNASAQTLVKVIAKDVAMGELASDVSDSVFLIGSSSPQLSDTLSNARTSRAANHDIYYTNDIDNIVTDGSIRITLADEFDLTSLTASDISVIGGDVSWGVPTVNPSLHTIIYPFSGSLNHTDGTVHFVLGGTHQSVNPPLAGNYSVSVATFASSTGSGTAVESVSTQVNINDGLKLEVDIPPYLEFDLTGVASGQNVNGAATNMDVLDVYDLNFGGISGGDNRIAAHDMTVNTNSKNGYLVEIRYSGPLSGPVDINSFTGTNDEPTTWLVPSDNGYFGYTTTDSTLPFGIADRFTSNSGNKWAGFSTTYCPVAGSDGPVDFDATRVGYRLNLAQSFGRNGVYATEIMYLVTTSY